MAELFMFEEGQFKNEIQKKKKTIDYVVVD